MKKILAIIMVLATALACYGQKKNFNFNEVLQVKLDSLHCYREKLHEDTVSYHRNASVFARTGKRTINMTENYKEGRLKSGTYIMQTPLNPSNIREYANKKGLALCETRGFALYLASE